MCFSGDLVSQLMPWNRIENQSRVMQRSVVLEDGESWESSIFFRYRDYPAAQRVENRQNLWPRWSSSHSFIQQIIFQKCNDSTHTSSIWRKQQYLLYFYLQAIKRICDKAIIFQQYVKDLYWIDARLKQTRWRLLWFAWSSDSCYSQSSS